MIDLDQNADLKDVLQQCIRGIKCKRPNLSSSSLAVSLNIATSTLGRIENGEVKKPEFGHALSIVRSAHGVCAAKVFADRFYPEVVENLNRIYTGNKEVPFIGSEAEEFFQGTQTYEMMMMATSASGLSREYVKNEFGSRGITILDSLIDSGALIERNGIITVEENINAHPSTVHKLAQNLMAKNYSVANFGTGSNWLSLQYESVNLALVTPAIRSIIEKASAEIRLVLNDPKNFGTDVFWTLLAADSLNSNGNSNQVKQ